MRNINDYVDKYYNEPFEPYMVQIRKNNIIKQLQKYRHVNILEIGCGLSPLFLDFQEFNNMVIVEPGEDFVVNARSLSENKCDIQIFQGFFEDYVDKLKKIAIEFDFIVCSSLIHEIDNPQKMLAGIRDVANENTIIHINVPNAQSFHRILAKEMGMIKNIHEQSSQMKLMQRQRTYDIDLLKQEIKDAGLMVIDSGSYFIKPFTHSQLQRGLDEKIIDEEVLDGLVKMEKYLPGMGAEIYVNCKKGRDNLCIKY